MVTFPQDLSLQDLRAIIHGLKMAGFTSLDEGAVDHIKFRINALPSAEVLSQIAQNPKVFRDLIVEVGEIMRLTETYSKQGSEYSARHKSKKKLPPRYKVLEWRSDMKNAKEIENNKKAAVVAFVKMSSNMDNIGHGVISGKLLKCATNIQSETYNQQEVDDVVQMLKSAGLEDEAVKIAGIGGFLGGLGKAVAAPFRDIWQKGRAGGLDQDFENIARQIERVYVKMQKLTADSQKAGNTQITQQMQHLMSAIQAAAQGWNKVINEANNDAGTGGQSQQPQGAQGAQPPQAKPQQAPQGSAEAPAEANLQNQIADSDIEEALKLAKGEKFFNRTAALDEKTKNWILELKRNSPDQYQSLMSSLQKRKEAMPQPQATATNPATPATPAPSTTATPTATPQQKPPVGTNAKLVPRQQKPQTNTGDPEADKFVSKLKKVPGDDIGLYEADGKRYRINEAKSQKWIQIV